MATNTKPLLRGAQGEETRGRDTAEAVLENVSMPGPRLGQKLSLGQGQTKTEKQKAKSGDFFRGKGGHLGA